MSMGIVLLITSITLSDKGLNMVALMVAHLLAGLGGAFVGRAIKTRKLVSSIMTIGLLVGGAVLGSLSYLIITGV